MLLPRFSIRTLLLIATAVAVVALFAGQAIGGRIWAVGVTVGVVSVCVALLVQAAFFALGSAFAYWLGPQEIVARTSRGGIERTAPPKWPASNRRSESPNDGEAPAK